ncbi:hypothetical protein PVC01_000117600 [Plasmodium vivax]|uniref:VIR protein n=1 Tax=Plasmodium vivax TaxID=5855 RepID=A0A1G4E4K2_PLAVI|nr:hypothetical protein PVC01_000117600 [Plasmodium vivax]
MIVHQQHVMVQKNYVQNIVLSIQTTRYPQEKNNQKMHLNFHISKFLSLFLFTPFRSWFLNRIGSKKTLKHKIKQDMDREFLGAPFQPPYRDDQNSRPRVGYSQN